jgi:hypothetical protein
MEAQGVRQQYTGNNTQGFWSKQFDVQLLLLAEEE